MIFVPSQTRLQPIETDFEEIASMKGGQIG